MRLVVFGFAVSLLLALPLLVLAQLLHALSFGAAHIGAMNFINASVVEAKSGKATLDTAGLGKITTASSKPFVQKDNDIAISDIEMDVP